MISLKNKYIKLITGIITICVLTFSSCQIPIEKQNHSPTHSETSYVSSTTESSVKTSKQTSDQDIYTYYPTGSESAYIEINNNEPQFTTSEITTQSYEFYSDLDSLGRCGYTIACIGKDLMPTEKRGSIGMIKPTGWHTIKYDFVDGKYLYNRCHLIGYQLSGENANKKNLITGTRYFNTVGMLPFENQVADYVKETNNHVMYRVTPIFIGDDLVATGVTMEAYSVEDRGQGISFNVFVYNIQPGVKINYHTGESELAENQ